MAIPAERLFETRGQDRLEQRFTFHSSTLHIPIRYYSSIWDVEAKNQERIQGDINNSLHATDVPQIAPRLFEGEDNKGFLQTVTALDPNLPASQIASVDGRFLQFGHKALMLLYQVNRINDESPLHFVAYVSREPEGSKLDAEALTDFRNLSELHSLWDQRVSEEAKKKFTVARPLATSQFVHGKNYYRYFTMTYLPYREISIEAFAHISSQTGELKDISPFLIYNINIDDETAAETATTQARAARNQDPTIWEKKRHDLLLAEALAYLVTDGRWPAAEHFIGAGDLNGVMTANEGFSTLGWTTVRGGFSEKPFPLLFSQTFITRMKYHLEFTFNPELRRRKIYDFYPFGDVSAKEFKQVLREAQGLLN